MKRKDNRFLRKVADLYYHDELSQDAIAVKLNISRTTVSRALSTAKKSGYIKVILDFPGESSIDIEKQLEEKYGIKEAAVAMIHEPEEAIPEVSLTAAKYLARVLKNDMIIGLTWGRTMKYFIDAFEKERLGKTLKIKGVQVIPFLGTNSPSENADEFLRFTYSSLLSSKLSELIRGINYSLPAPMYVQNPELKRLLIKEPEIANTLEKAKQCHVAIFSIGELGPRSAIGCLSSEKTQALEELQARGGIGEIMGRVFDQNGQTIESPFNDRLIGLTLEDLKKIPSRVAIISEPHKVPATKVALEHGLINVLITDSTCAELLLKEN